MSQADAATTKVILRELREGTPNTPERIAMFKRVEAMEQRQKAQRQSDTRNEMAVALMIWVEQHYAPTTSERVAGIIQRWLRAGGGGTPTPKVSLASDSDRHCDGGAVVRSGDRRITGA